MRPQPLFTKTLPFLRRLTGTYRAFLSDADGACLVMYEVLDSDIPPSGVHEPLLHNRLRAYLSAPPF